MTTTEQKPTPHPAKFSASVLEEFRIRVEIEGFRTRKRAGDRVLHLLDPFGGIGGIHDLGITYVTTYAVEIEEEWARQSAQKGWTYWGDFFEFTLSSKLWRADSLVRCLTPGDGFDIIATSCTYGNRMADSHTPSPEDTSTRITYRHKLGRPLSDNNSGGMQWGVEYREFHARAWRRVMELLVPGGLFLLNVSDHIRKGEKQPVVAWHLAMCKHLGFVLEDDVTVPTRRMRMGANGATRVEGEHVLVLRKTGAAGKNHDIRNGYSTTQAW